MYRVRQMCVWRRRGDNLLERFISLRFPSALRARGAGHLRLQHPHICVLYDVGHDDAAGEYLAMEDLKASRRPGG